MKEGMRVLVAEDDPGLREVLIQGLEEAGYFVDSASDGSEAIDLLRFYEYDVAVIDWRMPARTGLQVVSWARDHNHQAAILMLTARDTPDDRIAGLDAGADDYLVKPFAFAELLARLRVLLRRGRSDRETVLSAGDLEMDLLGRQVLRGKAEIALTLREFEVLEYLVRHKNTIVTRAMLGRDVWKEPDYALTNVIDVYINALRRKLEQAGKPPLIHTVRGVGYSLRDSGHESS
jgi:DNA-binding response OmpR family regulator